MNQIKNDFKECFSSNRKFQFFPHCAPALTTRVLLELSVNIIPSWMGWPCLSYHVKVAGGSATASQVKLEVPEIKP